MQASRPSDITAAKKAIRKEKLLWRKSLSQEEANRKSSQIAAALKALPEYAAAKTILFYVSAKTNEVDTHVLIRDSLAKNVRVLVPVTDFENRQLAISEIKAMEELVEVRFGLLEPALDRLRAARVGEADVIIVPGVVFDRQCRRVGFGGGYYDKLLSSTCKPALALAFEGQLVEEAPVDAYDMPVDAVVTECAVYRAEKRRC